MRRLARLGAVGLLVVAVALGTATTLMHVRLKLEILELGYLLGREARAERELDQAAERLRVELALLKSPARIEQTARNELGLRTPDPSQVRLLDPDRPWRNQAKVSAEAAAPAVVRPKPAAKPAQKTNRPRAALPKAKARRVASAQP